MHLRKIRLAHWLGNPCAKTCWTANDNGHPWAEELRLRAWEEK